MSDGADGGVLVGRVAELAALHGAWERVQGGGPATVLIGGEAGIGKSRLVSEFAAQARAAGTVRVLRGYCLELSADGLPFAPFTGVLRELVRDLGADGVGALLPPGGARDLARLLPEFGDAGTGADLGEARARMFEQVLGLFERLAEAGPVVLVIEDAHWSDRSTRDLLTFLAGNQQVLEGVLIVVTFRSDELHRRHPLRPVLAELDRLSWVVRLDLPRLTRREGREFMTHRLGREPRPELASQVYARSEGNPLFIEALLRRAGMPAAELPESLRDLMLADVRQLPAETQDLLQALGVAGQQCGHALLAAVTGTGDDALFAAMSPAVSANVLVPEADGYAFRHALIREAVVGEMLPTQKSRLHTRVAEALAADPSLVPPGRAVIEQAHHWYSAHDTARAAESAWQAAAEAGRSLAHAERLAMLERVLALWPALPDAARRIGASHLDVLVAAAEAAASGWENERGVRFVTAALGEIDAAAEPERAALMLTSRGEMKRFLGLADGIDDLREALRLMPPGAPGPARGQVLSSLANWLYMSGEPGGRATAEEALQACRQAGDTVTEARVLLTLARLDSRERGVVPLELLDQARALGGQAQDHDVLLRAAANESDLLEGMGEHERAAEAARRGLADAREYGVVRTHAALLAANAAESLVSLGRWDEAADLIEYALELFPPPGTRAVLHQLASELALPRGDLAGAERSAAASRDALSGFGYQAQDHLPLARLETELHLAQDRPGEALTAAGEALDQFSLLLSPRYAWPLLVAGARACAAALTSAAGDGLTGRANGLLDQLRAVAGKMGAAGPLQQAHRLTFEAEAARAAAPADSGPADSAPADGGPATGTQAAWDTAAAAWDGLSQPYQMACALLRAAEATLQRGDRDGAAQRLAHAAPLADRLDAGPLREQIASLARRARLGLPAGAADRPALGILGLTGREAEVLRLVAAGRSNRDIAAELFISAKTASVHVSNILAKLGVHTRVEAAAVAHQAGVTGNP